MKLSYITDKFIKKNNSSEDGKGLFVTIDDLIAQRRYAYQWQVANLNRFTTDHAGDVKSLFKGRGMEFEEIRAYTFGDDVRDIDWRVTARKQVPYTKLYAEEKDREVYVLLDFSSQMLFGTKYELKAVTAAKVTARIGWQCLKNKDRFGVVLFNGREPVLFKAQNSQANMMLIFKQIAQASQQAVEDVSQTTFAEDYLKKSINLLEKTIKHRAIVFIISDFADLSEETRKVMAMLSKKAKVTCVNILDCLEKEPPLAGEYMAQQSGQQLVFSSGSEPFREEYVRYFAQKHQQLKDFCHRFHLDYIEQLVGI